LGVILTPHISGVTAEANHRVSFMTVESVMRVLAKAR
jgi:phosphoglycerate dehydrogenase-like enzyme